MSEEWINSNNCKVQQFKSMQVLYGHICENNDDFHDKTQFKLENQIKKRLFIF
jgi:hypothetical protein